MLNSIQFRTTVETMRKFGTVVGEFTVVAVPI